MVVIRDFVDLLYNYDVWRVGKGSELQIKITWSELAVVEWLRSLRVVVVYLCYAVLFGERKKSG